MNRYNIGREFSVERTMAVALFCALAILFPSCTSYMEDTAGNIPDGYLHIDFSAPDTRADIGDDGSGNFTEGDAVGLYVTGEKGTSYHELTYTGGEWLPRLRRDEFGDGPLVLSAHYPVTVSDEPENTAFSVAEDQTGDGFKSSDLLFSRYELEEGKYDARMIFSHLMHRLRITLTGNMDGAEIKIRSILSGSVGLISGNVSLDGGSQFGWITPKKNSDGTFDALIIPQPASPYREGEGLLKISVSGKESVYNAPDRTSDGQSLDDFIGGKQTVVRLSVKEGNIDLANRILWAKGVNAPDFPGKDNLTSYPIAKASGLPEGEWGRYDYKWDEVQFLTWKQGCGWYDCNKSYRYLENDGPLCWAASASSLLIWWLNNNSEYIKAYDETYGSSVSTASGTIERPSCEFLPLYPNGVINDKPLEPINRAPVFEFFKYYYPNIGNDYEYAVNWFICGARLAGITGFNGFFHEVFDRSDRLAVTSTRQPTCEMFNEFLADAFLSGKALGFSASDIAGPNTGIHAMVIWGAEFDDSGLVSHIYYCDNNSADQDPNGAAIFRKAIVYEESGGRSYTYIQKLEPEEPLGKIGKYLITDLLSVDLGHDKWKQKFPDVSAE